jgi:hypothetical protein
MLSNRLRRINYFVFSEAVAVVTVVVIVLVVVSRNEKKK